jgi:isopentenyl diphosphate isomerase/L-lactate dehydrogenase-like FMN-dependent dehydrogenase
MYPRRAEHHRSSHAAKIWTAAARRGVGLPDNLIEYLPSLFNQAIQHYSCFISYSAKDQEFANRLHAELQNKGVRCWFAPHDMPIGGKIRDEIDTAIRLRAQPCHHILLARPRAPKPLAPQSELLIPACPLKYRSRWHADAGVRWSASPAAPPLSPQTAARCRDRRRCRKSDHGALAYTCAA